MPRWRPQQDHWALTRQIPAPFDQHLTDDAPDSSYGRAKTLEAPCLDSWALENQTDTIVSAADAVGITINVS